MSWEDHAINNWYVYSFFSHFCSVFYSQLVTAKLDICKENVKNVKVLLVSGSSAPSPIPPTTCVEVDTWMRAICSVGLRSVGSPGAVPNHKKINFKFLQTESLPFYSNSLIKTHMIIVKTDCGGQYIHQYLLTQYRPNQFFHL